MASYYRSLISHFSHPLYRLTAADSIGNFAATYTWDANGNLLDDGAKSYEYDLSNRLVSVDDGQAEVTFGYNGLGDRVQQSEGAKAIPATRAGVAGAACPADCGCFKPGKSEPRKMTKSQKGEKMSDYIEVDFHQILKDLLLLCNNHKLKPIGLGFTVAMKTEEYLKINPKYHTKTYPDMIRVSSESDGIIWNIKILRRLDPSDFPPATQPPFDLNDH